MLVPWNCSAVMGPCVFLGKEKRSSDAARFVVKGRRGGGGGLLDICLLTTLAGSLVLSRGEREH